MRVLHIVDNVGDVRGTDGNESVYPVEWQPVLEATLAPVPCSAASCWEELSSEEDDLDFCKKYWNNQMAASILLPSFRLVYGATPR